MQIFINNLPKEISENTTVNHLVFSILQLETAGMAIAINDCIASKQNWDTTTLQENDKILVIKACSGG